MSRRKPIDWDSPWPWLFLLGPVLLYAATLQAQPLRQELYIASFFLSAVGLTGLAGRQTGIKCAAVALLYGLVTLAIARSRLPKAHISFAIQAGAVFVAGLWAYDLTALAAVAFSALRPNADAEED